MKLLLYKILSVIMVAIFMYFLANRYMNWGINLYSVYVFFFISGISLIVMINSFISNECKKVLNPYSIYCFFIFLLGYSFIPLSNLNEKMDMYVFLILFFTVLFFLFGIYIGRKIKIRFVPLSIKGYNRLLIFRLSFILSIIVFLLECARVGFIPVFYILSTNVYKQMNDNAIPILHYFVQLANILPLWAYILYKREVISVKERNIVLTICIFIILNSLSRQMWVLTIICFGMYYMYYYILSKKRLLIMAVTTFTLFLLIGAIRLLTVTYNDSSDVDYLKRYSQIDYDVTLVEAYVGLYSTNNFTTFKQFVYKADATDYLGLGVYTLRPIYTLLGLNQFEDFDINEDLNSFSDLGTYAVEPYLDYGIFGVVIVNFLYGLFVAYTYKQYQERRERWIIPWAVMAFCIIMAAFTNFFNTFFVWLVLLLNFLILPPSLSYEKNR